MADTAPLPGQRSHREQAAMSIITDLRKRPGDLFFTLCFASFAMTSFLFDSQVALNIPQSADGPLLVRLNHWFASTADPILLKPPLALRTMITISAFVYGPFYLVLVYAFARKKNWIRIPALMYAATIVYSFAPIFVQTVWGDTRPTHLPLFLALYLPYLIVPLLLIYRMRHPEPFGPSDA